MDSKRILWTGSHGFIAGYAIEKLLSQGHEVWGIDNFWKYGKLKKSYDDHPNFHFIEADAKNTDLVYTLMSENKINVLVNGAAIIGGISMFHQLAYFLMRENELITAAAFDAAIKYHGDQDTCFEKILLISSSMVFENATVFPSREDHLSTTLTPSSTYGFQKLAVEYWAKGAWEQHKLPFTIVRPFNAVGIGEHKAKCESTVSSGNIKLSMSHVIPDLVQKILKGQYPLHILGKGNQVRHYTYAGDLAAGIYECIINPKALCEDFNISTETGNTVLELAKAIWQKIDKTGREFQYISDEAFMYDVQKRVPDVTKCRDLLGVTCDTTLETCLDEVIPWIEEQLNLGNI